MSHSTAKILQFTTT